MRTDRHRSVRNFALGIAAILFALPLRAQEKAPPPANPPSQSSPKTKTENKAQTDPGFRSKEQETPRNDRILWTLPNFLTVENAKSIPPLSTKEKFQLVARQTFDPVEFPFIAVKASIGQAVNSEPGYGQGMAGYGKRYGAQWADDISAGFLTGAILPSLFHQDPRYYQLGKGGFFHRASYSISRSFITRSDSGKR